MLAEDPKNVIRKVPGLFPLMHLGLELGLDHAPDAIDEYGVFCVIIGVHAVFIKINQQLGMRPTFKQ